MLARAGLKVTVISRRRRRNSDARSVNNVPYADGLSLDVIYTKMETDATRYGAELVWDDIRMVGPSCGHVEVKTQLHGDFSGRRLVLATGRVDALPSWLPDRTWGSCVFDCPYCHASERSGGSFVCVGDGENALKLAALARKFAIRMTAVISDDGAFRSRLASLIREQGGEVVHDQIYQASGDQPGPIRLVTKGGLALTADTVLLGDVVLPYT
jgi:thioredoxin reductase (NADPH)